MPATVHLALLALAAHAPSHPASRAPSSLETQQPSSLFAALPDDAVLAVAVEDFAALWERAPSTAWGELAADPLLAPLWTGLDELARSELGAGELSLEEALDGLAGAAFFVGPLEGEDPKSMGLVLRLRPGTPLLETALRGELARRGEPLELGGRTFRAGRGGHSGSWEVSFPWTGGLAVVEAGGREGALELASTLVRRLEAPVAVGGLVARLPRSRPADRSALEAYLDLGTLIASTLMPQGEQASSTLSALRLDDLGWGTLHVRVDPAGALEVDATLELPRGGPWPLLTAHLQPAPTRLARLAPAETIELALVGYDVQGAWSDLERWLEAQLPDAAEELQRSLERLASSADIDLEGELIGQLSGEFGRLLLPLPDGEQAGLRGFVGSVLLGLFGTPGSGATTVHLIALEDAAVVGRLLEKVIERSDAAGRVVREEVAGHELRSFEVPELQLQPGWARVDDLLVLSLHRSALRSVLLRAAADSPSPWTTPQRLDALRAGGAAVRSSVADLAGLTHARLAAPLALLLGLAGAGPRGADVEDPEALPTAIDETLPALVEKHVSGTAHSTLGVEGRILHYRFWTD